MRQLLLMLVLLLLASSVRAESALDTCLTVEGMAGDGEAFRRLVRSELDRHPSHRLSEESCTNQLTVERIEVAGSTYLTGRLAGQVPHRVRVDAGRLDRALSELLRVVLGNDPLVLRDPSKSDWFGRAMFGLRHRAHPTWGGSVLQRLLFVEGEVFALPELSVHYRRELEQWQAGIRLDVAANFEARLAGDDPRAQPTWQASLTPELTWFSSATADSALYASVGLGLCHQRFDVPRTNGRRGPGSETGLLVSLRAGVEILRTTDTRLGLFVDVGLPAFIGKRAEGGQGFVPGVALGAAVSF